ncbi:dihydrofolate reductase family protein [Streptomyces finlayi]|uniref:dihydrofolate reductase family protein n=1 Tax=Streptomyces finlayi TaxID=67296 RepID=UPI0040465EDB
MTDPTGRRVAANLALTLDGRYHGPGGPSDFGMFAPYVTTEVARDHLTRIWEGATTAVLGRVNAEGFLAYWPTVADDESADPRDRGYAKWLVGTEKVVFSTTLTEAPWERSRVVNAPADDVVAALKADGGG